MADGSRLKDLQEAQTRLDQVLQSKRVAVESTVQEQLTGAFYQTPGAQHVHGKEFGPPSQYVHSPLPRIDFPRFDGSNPRTWVLKCSSFFQLMPNIPDAQRINLAILHFDGRAFSWIQNLSMGEIIITWKQYLGVVCARFEKQYLGVVCARFETLTVSNMTVELNELKQIGSYEDYVERFEELRAYILLNDNYRYSEDSFVASFLSGLSEELQSFINMFQPRTLHHTIELGRKQLVTLDAISKKMQPPDAEFDEIVVLETDAAHVKPTLTFKPFLEEYSYISNVFLLQNRTSKVYLSVRSPALSFNGNAERQFKKGIGTKIIPVVRLSETDFVPTFKCEHVLAMNQSTIDIDFLYDDVEFYPTFASTRLEGLNWDLFHEGLELVGIIHIYRDIASRIVDFREFNFRVKDTEGMVRKMEKYANFIASFYTELDVVQELEAVIKEFQQHQHEERRNAFLKMTWQKQDVRHFKDVSLWNQTYGMIIELLARSLCTNFAHLCVVFGNVSLRYVSFSTPRVGFLKDLHARRLDFGQISGSHTVSVGATQSRQVKNERVEKTSPSLRDKLGIPKNQEALFRAEDYNSLGCMRRVGTWNHNLFENFEAPTSKFLKEEPYHVSWCVYWKSCCVCNTCFFFGILDTLKKMFVNGEKFHYPKLDPCGQGSFEAGGIVMTQMKVNGGSGDVKKRGLAVELILKMKLLNLNREMKKLSWKINWAM